MTELNEEEGTTLVLVTHDPELAARARRVIRLRDGRVVEDETHRREAPPAITGARG
jgi:predicted ABC-type transport system involved in lysophospholipase L1 biosynthesis ATPase subunit